MRHPQAEVTVTGVKPITQGVRADTQVRASLRLKSGFSDNGTVWALYWLTFATRFYVRTTMR